MKPTRNLRARYIAAVEGGAQIRRSPLFGVSLSSVSVTAGWRQRGAAPPRKGGGRPRDECHHERLLEEEVSRRPYAAWGATTSCGRERGGLSCHRRRTAQLGVSNKTEPGASRSATKFVRRLYGPGLRETRSLPLVFRGRDGDPRSISPLSEWSRGAAHAAQAPRNWERTHSLSA